MKKTKFTLIELMVVVAIIAVLAAMLLPALARARYIARNALYISNLRQISMSWLNYAGDFDDFWPDYDDALPTSDSFVDGWRRRSFELGRGTHDLRPALRSYVGGSFYELMTCPLATPEWMDKRLFTINPILNLDIDNAPIANERSVYSTYMLYPTGHAGSKFLRTRHTMQMRKVGDSFTARDGSAAGKSFRLLASDFTLSRGWNYPVITLLSTQSSFNERAESSGFDNHNEFIGSAWKLLPGMLTTANYALDDGSIRSYNVHVYSAQQAEYLWTQGAGGPPNQYGYLLPAELQD